MQTNVTESMLYPEKQFPVVFDASAANGDVQDWITANREYILEKVLRHGSVIFKNFGVNSMSEFEALAAALCPDLYVGYGDLPQRSNSKKLYNATPYTASLTIHYHNEASHTTKWPLKQFFYCIKPAEEGGELSVSDGRLVLKHLPEDIIEEFASKRLKYVRNFIPYMDVRWQDFYKTEDKAEVEAFCRDNQVEFNWQGDVLQTVQYGPAVVNHPQTNERIWFNQVQLHHPSMLMERVYSGLKAMLETEDKFPRYVCFGDGTPISNDTMALVGKALEASSINILAKSGDVIFNDNMLVAHSRLPYKGDREVCVALGEAINESQLQTNESNEINATA